MPLSPEEMLEAIPRELEGGTPLQLAYRRLVEAGVTEAAAEQAIVSATAGRANVCVACGYAYSPVVRVCSHCGSREMRVNGPVPRLSETSGSRSA